MIAGGGGTRLHVVETGNPRGQPILFIHGFSQSSFCWSRQLDSGLARDYRLVAMDLRGHGASEVPRDGYGDTKLWADDVESVIRDLELDRPIVCGWSYGPIVTLDYIRHYGEEKLGGIHIVAGISKLGSEAAVAVLTPEFLSLVPGFFSSEVGESVRSLSTLVGMCFARRPSPIDLYTMIGYNVSVPPHVRQALFARVLDADDVLSAMRIPVLVTHGADDAIVKTDVLSQQWSAIAHAQVHLMSGAGHAPFWDNAAEFNQRLSAFCREAARERSTVAA
jgi:pimeloyl-ACP methyl ester carboxylesterase